MKCYEYNNNHKKKCITRMRICQIEKIAIQKLKDKFSNFE